MHHRNMRTHCAVMCADPLEPSLVPSEILLKVVLSIHNPNQYLINNVHVVYSLSKANVLYQYSVGVFIARMYIRNQPNYKCNYN